MAQDKISRIATWKGLVEAATEIGQNRRNILERMKGALEAGNDAEALSLAKELCGLEK